MTAMPVTVLATKLHIPAPLPRAVPRERLLTQLGRADGRRLVLVSAPAGFGKSSLLSAWVAATGQRVAWLSLDADEGDPVRFLLYVLAALRTVEPDLASGVWAALQSLQPPPLDTLVTALLNELARMTERVCLVLDDYHVLDSIGVDEVVTALLENLPPSVTVVIATREDPRLPLARLRGRGQMVELRAADLRFTDDEARELLNEAMGLDLTPAQVEALEARTEGWIAGLQLAALSLQGRADAAGFIRSFTGSHRFIMDYLVEEVLARQPADTQDFLLRTAILDRLCGPLCDAVLGRASGSGQAELARIERANLFIVPLDDERRWFRYHHLFAELLRQRRLQAGGLPAAVDDHARASRWFEAQGLDAEAFQHAVASGDIDLAARLVIGGSMPLHFRGVVTPVLAWLDALAPAELDARPALWVMWASAQLFVGRIEGIEPKLRAAEARLRDDDPDPVVRDLVGHIASIRATVAVSLHRRDEILEQAQRALNYIDRNNLPVMTAACWSLGYAHHLRGDIAAAYQAYAEALSVAEAIGHGMIVLLATLGVGGCEEAWGDHDQALATYERVLALAGDPPLPVSAEALLGMARIHLMRGDLDAAEAYGQRAQRLARLMTTTDREFACDVLLARIQLSRGDVAGASTRLASARQAVEQRGFATLVPEIDAAHAEVDRARAGGPAAGLDALSARELEVLQLTAQGLSNAQIAERLVVALSTVKGHQQRIFEKLHVERRTEAVARARELGLL